VASPADRGRAGTRTVRVCSSNDGGKAVAHLTSGLGRAGSTREDVIPSSGKSDSWVNFGDELVEVGTTMAVKQFAVREEERDFTWPLPVEGLELGVFDTRKPDVPISTSAPSQEKPAEAAFQDATREATDGEANDATEGDARFPISGVLFLLLAVTAFETAYLGIRALDDWRRVKAEMQSSSMLPARQAVNPMTNVLPTSMNEHGSFAANGPADGLNGTENAGGTAHAGSAYVTLPIDVQVFEKGVFLGTSSDRLELSPGFHQLELVNESLGYRSMQPVTITAGRPAQVSPGLPGGTLSINAEPWSDVSIDGRWVGQTPLANIQVPIGAHQIVFRHPQFGEQTRTAVVSTAAPTRLSVDLRQ